MGGCGSCLTTHKDELAAKAKQKEERRASHAVRRASIPVVTEARTEEAGSDVPRTAALPSFRKEPSGHRARRHSVEIANKTPFAQLTARRASVNEAKRIHSFSE